MVPLIIIVNMVVTFRVTPQISKMIPSLKTYPSMSIVYALFCLPKPGIKLLQVITGGSLRMLFTVYVFLNNLL